MDDTSITENRYEILDSIRQERERQVSKWGGPEKDAVNNSPSDFVLYIANYATKWFRGGLPPHDTVDFRKSMIAVAALAVAAIEAYDVTAEKDADG